MREACFCDRTGEIEDRDPILDAGGRWALRCPDSGHGDYLKCLPEEAGLLIWGEAMHRREREPGLRSRGLKAVR